MNGSDSVSLSAARVFVTPDGGLGGDDGAAAEAGRTVACDGGAAPGVAVATGGRGAARRRAGLLGGGGAADAALQIGGGRDATQHGIERRHDLVRGRELRHASTGGIGEDPVANIVQRTRDAGLHLARGEQPSMPIGGGCPQPVQVA
ncbi:MAG TPA: hypothetical protein DEG88_14170, partial [Propionibacteriaceae bacterium]|nr:hypothetical protein [Propionibacteriaceae bacterium]